MNPPKEAAVEPFGDILVTIFSSWNTLAQRLVLNFLPRAIPGDDVSAVATELTRGAKSPEEKLQALYDFVSKKIRTVDLDRKSTRLNSSHSQISYAVFCLKKKKKNKKIIKSRELV